MGHDWKERLSEGRMISRREPVLGYRVPIITKSSGKYHTFHFTDAGCMKCEKHSLSYIYTIVIFQVT